MATFFRGFLADEKGISSVEYALLLAFVGGGVVMGASLLSDAVSGEMSSTADCIESGTVAVCEPTPPHDHRPLPRVR